MTRSLPEKILPGRNFRVRPGGEQRPHRLGLIVAMLDQQPARREQMRRASATIFRIQEAVGAVGQRQVRLEGQAVLQQMRIACGAT